MSLDLLSIKKKKRILLLLVVLGGILSLVSCTRATYPFRESHAVLELKIENKKYDHLSLFTHVKNSLGYDNGLEIPGKSADGFKWTFLVPDSVNQVVEGYYVRTQPFDYQRNEEKTLTFSAGKVSDRTSNMILLRDKTTSIRGSYTHQISNTHPGMGFLLVDTFIMNPTITCDVIDLKLDNKKCKSELEIALSYPCFDDTARYTLSERLDVIRKYPYSTYLLGAMPSFLNVSDRKTLRVLFNSFSDEIRNSQQGQDISNLINVEIEPVSVDTLKLMGAEGNLPESVIRTHSKYTLIIFSASWCSPCHKQIPLLKEVYNDFGSRLDMVYISTDQEKEEKYWNRMLENEEIPWRSLFARNYRKGLLQYYSIGGIPYSLLVHPDGTTESIDIRKQSDRSRLYKLLNEGNRI